jgi:PAS domain S-box-containing protein
MLTERPNDHEAERTSRAVQPPLPQNGHATRQIAELHRLLVESVSDYAIFALDARGNVASWNAGAERLKGYAPDEIIGRHMTTFYPADKVAEGYPAMELEVATRDGRFEDEGWRVRKDGSRFWANVIITAMRDDDGQLIGFAKVTRDLTARREREEQQRLLAAEEAALAEAKRRNDELTSLNARLQKALRAAAEAYHDLDQFAYAASHDLKAPLRGIANLAQWIREDLGDKLNEESAEHMRMLQSRVRRMEALVDGILTYSRAGRHLTEPEEVNSDALVNETIELIPLDGATINVAPDMPSFATERVPLQQVFINLVSNALKHGRGERSNLVVDITWRDAGEFHEFAVADNGPGIAPEFHDRIWGIFQTLESRDKVEGTGIGLSVVRKIVESRGGRAWIESSKGSGATFRFTWPKRLRPGAQE